MSPAATIGSGEATVRILTVADELFYEHGVGTVTMSDIRDRSGISMRRIYSLFPAKSDLIAGWLSHRHETWMAWFEGAISAGTADGASPLDAMFDALADWLKATNHRGCGFINTLAENTELTNEHRLIIRSHKQALVESLASHTRDPAALAVLIDGAIVRSAAMGDTTPVEAARRAGEILVAAALTQQDPLPPSKD